MKAKTQKKAYCHVVYCHDGKTWHISSPKAKNVTLTAAKNFMKEQLPQVLKNYRLLGAKAEIVAKTPTKVKIKKAWEVEPGKFGKSEITYYMIKKTETPIPATYKVLPTNIK